jgi:dihydrodipicolinate synthase/N-acetylneuraminate lyase
MKQLQGICPIVAVPFEAGGQVDFPSFERLVEHLMGTGVQGLMLFGLASEFYKLADGERDRLRHIMLERTRRHPTVAGVISVTDHSWEVAVGRAIEAEEAGADALNIFPPFFLSPGEGAIVEHISRVLSAVNIPVIVQYAPAQSGVRLPPELFANLAAEHSNLRFVKVETQPPGRYAAELLASSGGKLHSLIGYAGVQMPDVLQRGAAGIQPGCSFAELYVEMYHLYSEGSFEAMRAMHTRLLPYISYWMQSVELIIQAEKTVLLRRGIISTDYCRSPRYALDAVELGMVDAFLHDFSAELSSGGVQAQL